MKWQNDPWQSVIEHDGIFAVVYREDRCWTGYIHCPDGVIASIGMFRWRWLAKRAAKRALIDELRRASNETV